MTSKARQKGYRTVSKGRQIFLKQGYIACNLEKSSRFVKQKDLFNLWDYIFIRGKEHVFVQFKTNLKGQKWKQPFIDFGKKHGSNNVKYQIWNKFDYKGFEIIECN